MFRQAALRTLRVASLTPRRTLKTTTGIVGLPVHPNPLPALTETYESTLTLLKTIPESSIYRQSIEALTQHKLNVVQQSGGDAEKVEKELEQGQIEELLDAANDELSLLKKMAEWKPWEALEHTPLPGQWEYFGKSTTESS